MTSTSAVNVCPRARCSAGTSDASSKYSGRMPRITRSRSPTALEPVAQHRDGAEGRLDRGRPRSAPGTKFIGGEPMKPGDEQVHRLLVEVARRADLLEHALAQHRDAVAEGHRLGLVVGDVDRGGAEPPLHAGDLGAHLAAQLGVQVGQRLVEQERVGLAHDRPAHRHPLPLAAGEVGRLAVEVLGELERGRPPR